MICSGCSGEMSAFFAARDQTRTGPDEVFRYERCGRCGLVSLANVPVDLGASGVDLASLAYPRGRPALGQTAMLFSTKEFDAMHKRLQAAGPVPGAPQSLSETYRGPPAFG